MIRKPIKRPRLLRHPELDNAWKENFKKFAMRVGFCISLSRPMLEFLCAVADGVAWDRDIYPADGIPSSWIATSRSLEKRGLIEHKGTEATEKLYKGIQSGRKENYEWNMWQLTPPGKLVVQLVKRTGLFIESDAAITKKARKA